jgi:hypothetical protein
LFELGLRTIQYVSKPSKLQLEAMYQVMDYVVATPYCGLELKPDTYWDGSANFEFKIVGHLDSEYSKNKDTRRSMAGWSVLLHGCPVSSKSKMLIAVLLSVTKVKLFSGCSCMQDMMVML